MADLKSTLKSQYKDYATSFKQTSFDSENKEHLCQDETVQVYDFDKIVKEKYPSKQPASTDVLLLQNHTLFCIEFKNQKPSNIDNANIKIKFNNTQEIIKSIFKEHNLQTNEITFIFCVAYKPSVTQWKRGVANNILFGLEEFKGKFFNDIFTNDVSWFKKEYKKNFKELQC